MQWGHAKKLLLLLRLRWLVQVLPSVLRGTWTRGTHHRRKTTRCFHSHHNGRKSALGSLVFLWQTPQSDANPTGSGGRERRYANELQTLKSYRGYGTVYFPVCDKNVCSSTFIECLRSAACRSNTVVRSTKCLVSLNVTRTSTADRPRT